MKNFFQKILMSITKIFGKYESVGDPYHRPPTNF